MLNCTDSLSTNQVHLPHPGANISSSGSSLYSAPPRHRVHKWGGMPAFPLWLPAASECTLLWGAAPRLPVPPPLGDITTTVPPHVSPSSPWSAWTLSGGTPPGPSSFSLSPPNYHCHTVSTTDTPPYASSHGPAPLLPSLPTPSQSSPTASALSSVSDTPTENRCCCSRLSVQVKGRPLMVAGTLQWSGTIP